MKEIQKVERENKNHYVIKIKLTGQLVIQKG